MTRLSFIVIAFFLVLAACTAKLQQHSNNNTSNNSTTVDKGLQGGAGKRDSIKTIEEKTKVSFTENATNYTYVPTMDTPAILKKDNPIWQVAGVDGRYEDFWRISGGVHRGLQITPEDFMQKYVLPNIGVSEINELRYTHKYEADKFGIGHYYYTQYYKGLKTMRHFNLSTKNGFVLNFDSSFDPLLSLNIVPIITEQQAWDSIKVFLAATDTKTNFKKYWEALNEFSKNEFPHDQQLINELTYTLSLDVDWNGKRMINLRKGDHLVYKFTLIHRSLPLETICVVDPFIGKILGYGSVNY